VVKKKKKKVVKKKPLKKVSKRVKKKKNTPTKKPKFISIQNSEKNKLRLTNEKEIALNFATKVYKKFSKIIKSIILFGSSTKKTSTTDSDIDIIIIVDDASIAWDPKLIAWYREELRKILAVNKYSKNLHVNTTKLTSWWEDLIRGDPVVINVIRYGEAILDFGGFFNPLKILLEKGKIKSTPEAIYTALQRAPAHLARSKAAEIGAVEGVYWAMVDSSHAALIAANRVPPSPEHIPLLLKEVFVDNKLLKMKHILWYRDVHDLHTKIAHGRIRDLKGSEIDLWQERADVFIGIMANLVKNLVNVKK